MNDTPRDPLQAYLVIDGPLQGELRAHDNSTFEVLTFPQPSWVAHIRPPRATDAKELGYVRYWLREDANRRLVWSCKAPGGLGEPNDWA